MSNEHAGHRSRLRDQFLASKPGTFHPHQLLELLLFYSIPVRDTNSLAHAIIQRFGTVDRVFAASIEELMTVDGVGFNTAVLIKAVNRIYAYYGRIDQKRIPIDGPLIADAYFRQIIDPKGEGMLAISLTDLDMGAILTDKTPLRSSELTDEDAIMRAARTVNGLMLSNDCKRCVIALYLPDIPCPGQRELKFAEQLTAAAEMVGGSVKAFYLMTTGSVFDVTVNRNE